MKRWWTWACCAGLAACASGGVGKWQAEIPPRLVMKAGFAAWDYPAAFGPVPPELMETGAQLCKALDTSQASFRAAGYHARAQDLNGNPLAGGGYYCVRR